MSNLSLYAAAILVLLLITLFGRQIARVTLAIAAPLVRLAIWVSLILRRGLRAFGNVVRRSIGLPAQGSGTLAGGGTSEIVVSLPHVFDMTSLSEVALGEVSDEIRSKVKRRGLFFTRIEPSVEDAAADNLSFEEAQEFKKIAQEYYNKEVTHELKASMLYEDVEGAFIIEMMSGADKAFFFTMIKFRKTINRNVFKYVGLQTIIWITSIVAAALYVGVYEYFKGTILEQGVLITPLFTLGFAILAMGGARMVYSYAQRENGLQMNNFVSLYLSAVSRKFQAAETNLSSEAQDQTKTVGEIGKRSGVWYSSFQWNAVRLFFLEIFVRNIVFQVVRNTSFYIALVPATFVAFMVVVYFARNVIAKAVDSVLVWWGQKALDLAQSASTDPTAYSITAFAVGSVIYGLFLVGLLEPVRGALRAVSWSGFRRLQLWERTERIIVNDRTEIANLRRRFTTPGA